MQTGPQLINFIHVVLFIMQISSNVFKSTCGGGELQLQQRIFVGCTIWALHAPVMDPVFHAVKLTFFI